MIFGIVFYFRDNIAFCYANFLYKEVLPNGFDKAEFSDFKNKMESSKELDKIREIRQISKIVDSKKRETSYKSAILMLGGMLENRLFQAVSLYYYGAGDLILITEPRNYIHNDFGGSLQSELSQATKALQYLKVNFSIISSLKNGAQSTRDEAFDTIDFLKNNEIENIILVTDEFHSKRAYETFRREFKKANISTNLFIIPASNKFYNIHTWHKDESGIINYTLELPKIIMFYLKSYKIRGVTEH